MQLTTWAAIAAITVAIALLILQIVGGLEYTEGGSFYTRASMIAAMVTIALLPIFIDLAIRYKATVTALPLGIAFLAFLAYSLPATVGRTAEVKQAKVAEAADVARSKDDLERVTVTLTGARSDMISECGSGEGKRCRAKRNIVQALEARQVRLRQDLRTGESRGGDMGSDLWAWALSGVGVTGEHVRKASVMAFAIGLDVVIWGLVWFAMAVTRVSGTVSTAETVGNSSAPASGGGGRSLRLVDGTTIEDRELKALREALAGRRKLTNDELAALLKVSKAESSRRVTKAIDAGIVSRQRVGRHVAIALQTH